MGIVLFRVDERLIHGQVTVGWGNRLKPHRYIVVDDTLVDRDFEQDLYRLGVPDESEAEFCSVEDARAQLPSWLEEEARIVLLTRDVDHMRRLAAGGALRGHRVNLGGIHYREGRTRVLPFLFLGHEERTQIRELAEEGVDVSGQDLPGQPETSSKMLVDA